MRQIIKFLKIRFSEIMNQKNETDGMQKIFLMLILYQTALYIFKAQFHFLVNQLGHSFTIIGSEKTPSQSGSFQIASPWSVPTHSAENKHQQNR
jgi:hypothetical protein